MDALLQITLMANIMLIIGFGDVEARMHLAYKSMYAC